MISIAPHHLRRLHLGMTGMWALAAIPTVLWWHDSVLWVGIMSCYANFVGHFSAWQASRVETANAVAAVPQDDGG